MNKEAPNGWEFVPADKYCTEVTDGTHDSPKPVEYNGHYLLTSKNVTSGILNYENAYCISEEDFNAVNKRSKVNQYDLLYSMIGTVGESCIVEQDKIDFAIKNVGLFRLNGDLLKAKWLNYFFKSNIAKTYVEKSLKGATQKYIALGVLRKFPILIPSTTAEQQEIVQVLDTMSDIIRLREECISHAQDLIPALFREMFGKIERNTRLNSIISLEYGKALKAENRNSEGEYPVYGSNGIVGYHDSYIVEGQTIIVGRKGSCGKLNLTQKSCFPIDTCFYIKQKTPVNWYYLFYALQELNIENMLKDAVIPGINRNDYLRNSIRLASTSEQEQFAQKAIEIESYIKEQQEELENAKQMFQSLLHHAFTGELTNNKPQGDTLEK